MRNLRRKMDTQTVDLSTFSADLMDTPQTADSSIFKAPADVHCFFLARNRVPGHDGVGEQRERGRDSEQRMRLPREFNRNLALMDGALHGMHRLTPIERV